MVPKLLFDIAKCCNFQSLINTSNTCHPCDSIIEFQRQKVTGVNDFQLPEPWSGDIVNAPILVISSNPAYSQDELYPTLNWPDNMIADFFINRFKDRGKFSWVLNNRVLNKNGSRGRSVKYWSSIQGIIGQILGRPATPGKDYCITELVHCKSSKQIGVNKALRVCAGLFCKDLIRISGAKLIIVVGSIARNYIRKCCSSPHGIPTIYLPHPSSGQMKKLSDYYSKKEIEDIRKVLQQNKNEDKEKEIECLDIDLPTDEEVEEFIKQKIEEYQKQNNTP